LLPEEWDLTSFTCSDGSDPASIALAAGETVTCTYTNTARGSIVIVKDTIPDDPEFFSFTTTSGPDTSLPPGFSLDDDGVGDNFMEFTSLKPGSYTVAESQTEGWSLVDMSCDDGNSTGNVGDRKATVNLEPGETVTCKFKNIKASVVTDSSFCPLTNNQFRLTYLQDPASPGTYRLNSSNPGQFYYNVFYSGKPTTGFELSINIPYPFANQGAVPNQVHDNFSIVDGCFVAGPNIEAEITTDDQSTSPSGAEVILLSDYEADSSGTTYVGDTEQIYILGTVPASGVVYVTIHLDYDLKRTVGWSRSTDGLDTGINGSTPPAPTGGEIHITSPQEYVFFSVSGSVTDEAKPQSINNFKKIPGFAGVVETLGDADGNGAGDPLSGMTVEVRSPSGSLLGTAVTDEDGVYFFEYKHKGKPEEYTLKVLPPGIVRRVSVKANSFNLENFEVPNP
jgi:hypothetical protein